MLTFKLLHPQLSTSKTLCSISGTTNDNKSDSLINELEVYHNQIGVTGDLEDMNSIDSTESQFKIISVTSYGIDDDVDNSNYYGNQQGQWTMATTKLQVRLNEVINKHNVS